MLKEMLDHVREKCPLIHNITNYVTVNDCANILLACGGSPIMADDAEEAEEVVRYVYDVDLLIIDDLGTEFVTQFTTAAFFDVINSRIISGKSTIISSNLDFEKLSEIYSQRITSRFMGDYTIVQTVGRDLRAVIKRRNKR